ncbi:MAG: DUF2283 domain-containing protein [Phycisphaeraceae bacterium]|nr:DUF2283 domain-containing protein [Phycisphaeraceae bacterium]
MDQPLLRIEVSFSEHDDGTLEAAYIRFSDQTVAETREIAPDAVLADYDDNGHLIGIELLTPIRLADLEQIAGERYRGRLKDKVPPIVLAAA